MTDPYPLPLPLPLPPPQHAPGDRGGQARPPGSQRDGGRGGGGRGIFGVGWWVLLHLFCLFIF